MSEIKYGLISKVDSGVLEKTIDLICQEFPNDGIRICEVGIYGGDTADGINKYIARKHGRTHFITGIDNNRDGEENRFHYYKLIKGNSSEVYNQIPDNSQHLCFIDALHTKIAVIGDFYAYAPKVKVGGFLCFHDTGRHLDPLSGWQGVGDKNDPDFCLGGVRRALNGLGLLSETGGSIFGEYFDSSGGWELIFDEADPEDSGGGICCFRRLY